MSGRYAIDYKNLPHPEDFIANQGQAEFDEWLFPSVDGEYKRLSEYSKWWHPESSDYALINKLMEPMEKWLDNAQDYVVYVKPDPALAPLYDTHDDDSTIECMCPYCHEKMRVWWHLAGDFRCQHCYYVFEIPDAGSRNPSPEPMPIGPPKTPDWKKRPGHYHSKGHGWKKMHES